MRTDGHGVARAGKGMLITTEARTHGRGPIRDMDEIIQRIKKAAEQHQALIRTAQDSGAQETGSCQSDVAESLLANTDSIRGVASSNGKVLEFSKPHLVLASPEGLVTAATNDTHIVSGRHMAVTAGKNISLTAGSNIFASAIQTLRIFAQKAGMKLIASAGDIDIQALSNNLKLLAKLDITQSANRIIISAKQEIVLNGGGSYAKFGAGFIEMGTTGTFTAHAVTHSLPGAKGMSVNAAMAAARNGSLVATEEILDELMEETSWVEFRLVGQHGAISGERFILTDPSGKSHSGTVDDQGMARIEQIPTGRCKVEFPDLDYSLEVSTT